MSDTHAHTANVQADVQTGKPHMPPGHVEADRPVKHVDAGPDGRRWKPALSWAAIAAIGLVVLVLIVFFMA